MTQKVNRIRKLIRILSSIYGKTNQSRSNEGGNGQTNTQAELQIEEIRWFAELSVFKGANVFGASYIFKPHHPAYPPTLNQFINLCVQTRNNRKFERICQQIELENQFLTLGLSDTVNEPGNEYFRVYADWDLVIPQLARKFAQLWGKENTGLDFFEEQPRKLHCGETKK